MLGVTDPFSLAPTSGARFFGELVLLVFLGVTDPFPLAPTSGARFLGDSSPSSLSSSPRVSRDSSFSRDSSLSRASSPTAQPEPLRGEHKRVYDPNVFKYSIARWGSLLQRLRASSYICVATS